MLPTRTDAAACSVSNAVSQQVTICKSQRITKFTISNYYTADFSEIFTRPRTEGAARCRWKSQKPSHYWIYHIKWLWSWLWDKFTRRGGCSTLPVCWKSSFLYSSSLRFRCVYVYICKCIYRCMYVGSHRTLNFCIHVLDVCGTWIYMFLCTYLCVFASIHVYTYMHVHKYTCVYVHIYIHIHIDIYIYINIFIHVYTYTHICICIYIYIYVYVYMYTKLQYLEQQSIYMNVYTYMYM